MDAAMAAVVTLPRLVGSRDRARNVVTSTVHEGTRQVLINALDTESISQGAADEMVKVLLRQGVEKVVLLNMPTTAKRYLHEALDRRAEPGTGFLLLSQQRDPSVLYRE